MRAKGLEGESEPNQIHSDSQNLDREWLVE
jgi:hypothetical protein